MKLNLGQIKYFIPVCVSNWQCCMREWNAKECQQEAHFAGVDTEIDTKKENTNPYNRPSTWLIDYICIQEGWYVSYW